MVLLDSSRRISSAARKDPITWPRNAKPSRGRQKITSSNLGMSGIPCGHTPPATNLHPASNVLGLLTMAWTLKTNTLRQPKHSTSLTACCNHENTTWLNSLRGERASSPKLRKLARPAPKSSSAWVVAIREAVGPVGWSGHAA